MKSKRKAEQPSQDATTSETPDDDEAPQTDEVQHNAHRTHYFQVLSEQQVQDMDKKKHQSSYDVDSFAAQYRWSISDRLHSPPTVDTYRRTLMKNFGDVDQLQNDLLRVFASHVDVFYPARTHTTAASVMAAYTLHALNHVLTNRRIILEHNEKLRKMSEKTGGMPVDAPDAFRDQGVVRPKVLILVPFRSRAHAIVQLFAQYLFGSTAAAEHNESDAKAKRRSFVTNRVRFDKEYLPDPDERESRRQDLPSDYKQTFSGNVDDCFRVGISVAKKALKLYVDLYNADIILASPLGLRSIMGAEGEEHYEYDFLCSIELLIVDECDVLLMQNWAHVLHIFQHLHKTPRSDHGADFSRVHLWQLNGWSQHYRQTLLFSEISAAAFHAVMNKHCSNYAGQLSVQPHIAADGACAQVFVRVSQTLHRFPCASAAECSDARFEHFTTQLLARCINSRLQHVLVVVPDYYDFVRVRNNMKQSGVSAVFCSEYSSNKKVAAARAMLFNSSKSIMVITERWHFYKRLHTYLISNELRYQLRGIEHLIFYQPPLYPKLYAELTNLLQLSVVAQPGIVLTAAMLYSKYDALRLAGIFGEERTADILTSDKPIHIITNE